MWPALVGIKNVVGNSGSYAEVSVLPGIEIVTNEASLVVRWLNFKVKRLNEAGGSSGFFKSAQRLFVL